MSDSGPRGDSVLASISVVLLPISIASLLGFVSLALEFAVVRLSAPWFGQGTHVWANTVALVLFALALGYAMGGRLADRGAGRLALTGLCAAGALWLAGAAILGPTFAEWLAPAAIGADRPHPLSLFGSLAGTAALVGPPLLVIGAMSPVLVVLAAARSTPARASGLVSAAGTIGGLVGCATAPTLFVPALGSRGTLLLAAAGLAAAGLIVSFARSMGARKAFPTKAPAPPHPIGRRRISLAVVSAVLCGTVITLLEFAIVRKLAPVYGADNTTWATVVGTILVMSALGSAYAPRARGLLRFAPVPVLWLILDNATPLFIQPYRSLPGGPVIAALVAGLCVPFLSAVPPLLVGSISRRGRVGRVVSVVYGASTVGNVIGCYLAPLVLLPMYGTRVTFFVAGGLAMLGFVAAWLVGIPARLPQPMAEAAGATDEVPLDVGGARTRWAGPALAVLTLALVALASLGIAGPLRLDPGQLEEIETAYSTIRVSERTEPGPKLAVAPLYYEMATYRGRYLGFDEDTTSYQSVRLMDAEATALTGGRYYEHLALGAWFRGQPWARSDGGAPRVLIVGYCGGTLHRILAATAPKGREPLVTGIEIDPEVVALARRQLGPLPDHLELLVGVDGRAGLASLPPAQKFDLILVDAYQRTQYVPFHLSTVEFFRECASRLTPNGYLGINSDSEQGASGKLVRCLAESVAETFHGDAWLVPNPIYPGNVAIWGSASPVPPRVGSGLDARLEFAGFTLDRFLVKYERGQGGAFALTDDRSPTEALADEALLAVEDAK